MRKRAFGTRPAVILTCPHNGPQRVTLSPDVRHDYPAVDSCAPNVRCHTTRRQMMPGSSGHKQTPSVMGPGFYPEYLKEYPPLVRAEMRSPPVCPTWQGHLQREVHTIPPMKDTDHRDRTDAVWENSPNNLFLGDRPRTPAAAPFLHTRTSNQLERPPPMPNLRPNPWVAGDFPRPSPALPALELTHFVHQVV